jgi:hypothetical protein
MQRQPPRQIGRTAEIQERLGEGFQLLQRQGLDAGGGGLAQGAAATVEQAVGDGSGLGGAATGFALQSAFFDPILGETGVAQVIGGEIDQGHDFLASEMGKPTPQDRENGFDKIGPRFQDPIGGAADVGFGQHRQRQQAEQRIKPWLLAELLEAEPVHTGKKRLQLKRQLGGAETEPLVRNHHDHGQMQHLGMELPLSLPRGQSTPSRRWFTALSSGASKRYSASPGASAPKLCAASPPGKSNVIRSGTL